MKNLSLCNSYQTVVFEVPIFLVISNVFLGCSFRVFKVNWRSAQVTGCFTHLHRVLFIFQHPTPQGCCYCDEIVLYNSTLQFPTATFFQFENPVLGAFRVLFFKYTCVIPWITSYFILYLSLAKNIKNSLIGRINLFCFSKCNT